MQQLGFGPPVIGFLEVERRMEWMVEPFIAYTCGQT